VSKNENLKPFAIDAGKASVALAVASLCAVGAQAATVGSGGRGLLSIEKATVAAGATGGSTAASTLGEVLITLGATYAANDVLVLSLGSNVSFASGSTSTTPKLTCASGVPVQFDVFDRGSSFIKFRVPAAMGSTTTFAGACTLVDATLLDSTIDTVGEYVTISASGVAGNGQSFDSSGAAANVSRVINSLAASVSTALDGVVDPAANNKKFKSGSVSDVISFAFTSTAVDNPITLGTGTSGTSSAALTFDVNGDFTFLVNTGETTSSQILGATTNYAIGTTGTLTTIQTAAGAAVTGLRLRIEKTSGNFTNGEVGQVAIITTGASNANALTPQTYSGTYTITGLGGSGTPGVYTARTGTTTPGQWTQGGTTIFVPYMPVGSSITQVLYIANNTAVAGSTTVTAKSQSGGTCTTAAVTTAANANTNLSDALASAIATCQAAGTVAATDKLMLTIVATTNLAYTEVYSGFTVSGSSRVTIPNSSNGYKPQGSGQTTVIGSLNADNTL